MISFQPLVVIKVRIPSICLPPLKPLAVAKLSQQNHLTQQTITELVELVVSLFVNDEEYLLRTLPDTGASSSSILEAYTSAPFIKTDDSNTTTWITKGGTFTTTKTGICL
jgi:hypothetical protein